MSETRGKTMFDPLWREVQARGLVRHLRHARTSALYRGMRVPAEGEITGESLGRVLAELPLTTKDQLAAAGRTAFAVELEKVAEWVCTSGTLGKPLDVPLTARDLERVAENEAVALDLAGVRVGDLVVLAVGMDRLFVAGLAYWLGARRIGAACVRAGPRLAEQPGMLKELWGRLCGAGGDEHAFDADLPMPITSRLSTPERSDVPSLRQKHGTRAGRMFVMAVPSYLGQAERAEVAGIMGIGEPVRVAGTLAYNSLGERLRERFGCPVMSTYASTETCTTLAEGPMCRGGHVNPELGIVEVLDGAGKEVPAGEVGEVVVTPLGVEGMPLVRFRTGDMAALHVEACACGRITPRLGPIVGRRQQLLKVRGVSIFPGTIIEALRGVRAVSDCAIVAEEESPLSDRLTIYLCAGEGAVRQEVEARLRAVLRVVPEVRYVEAEELRGLQMSGGRKVVRFIDRRGQVGM